MNRKVVFWASVEPAMFLRAVVDSICAEGVQATHRYVISSSAYKEASTPLQRIVLRFRMYIEYPVRLAWVCVFDREPRIYIVTTNTFFAPLIASLLSRKNQFVIHLVWDLYPDALFESNGHIGSDWISRCIEGVVQQILTRVAANVFIGQRLLAHAKNRFIDVPKAHIIPVGADAGIFVDSPPCLVRHEKQVDILYCGNLGAMHDTTTVLDALQSADSYSELLPFFTLTFNASGPLYEVFKNKIGDINSVLAKNINLGSGLVDVEWTCRMKQAHVALVMMKPGSEKVVMPSKTYSALAAGQAILAICPEDSDLAQLVIKEDCGWVVTPGRQEELWDALNEIATRRDVLQTKRENAYRAGHFKYSDVVVAREWVKLVNALTSRP
jgi:colanic acid biosynthesis glycosyl transferase WcaI